MIIRVLKCSLDGTQTLIEKEVTDDYYTAQDENVENTEDTQELDS